MGEGHAKNSTKLCIEDMYSLRNWGRYAHLSQYILYVDQEGGLAVEAEVADGAIEGLLLRI